LLEQQIDITKKSLQDAQFNTQIGLDRTQIGTDTAESNARITLQSAQSALDYVVNTKDTTLQTLENTRRQAEVAYQESLANIGKFSVDAPIEGQITDVFVDVGQDVTP